MTGNGSINYNPDVLSCLANLSNDEVFTPPAVANAMLNMLPRELFKDPNAKFLDPAVKSGVFLREIAKRLNEGLKEQIPDDKERIAHILQNQVYGIAITELTSLMSRRSLYCSTYPNGRFSVVNFGGSAEGNIHFKRIEHTWSDKDKCIFCGASRDKYDRGADRETHAYEWIHTQKPEEIFEMKFDVIISNPPYQMTFGIEGGNSANAKSIYNLFIERAIKLNPRYICMITPSRWMTKTAQGIPDSWVDSMLKSNKIEELHDFSDVHDCFPGVKLTGGVSYFKWKSDYNGKCKYVYHYSGSNTTIERYGKLDALDAGVVVRDPKSYELLKKIILIENDYYKDENKNFSGLVSPKHFFDNSELLTSNWKGWQPEKNNNYNIKYYISKSFNDESYGFISLAQLPKNHKTLPLHKVYIPAAHGSMDNVIGKPFYGEPNSVCSQTYLVIGYDPEKHNFSKAECRNIITYIQTKFFRYLVSIKKKTQNGPRGVYQFVPLQDFSKPWTDEELYAKYNLSREEIDFIESMIKPMDLGDDNK